MKSIAVLLEARAGPHQCRSVMLALRMCHGRRYGVGCAADALAPGLHPLGPDRRISRSPAPTSCAQRETDWPLPSRRPGFWTNAPLRMNRSMMTANAPGNSRELVGLLDRIARGERAALAALYQRTSAKLYGVCLRLLGSEE